MNKKCSTPNTSSGARSASIPNEHPPNVMSKRRTPIDVIIAKRSTICHRLDVLQQFSESLAKIINIAYEMANSLFILLMRTFATAIVKEIEICKPKSSLFRKTSSFDHDLLWLKKVNQLGFGNITNNNQIIRAMLNPISGM